MNLLLVGRPTSEDVECATYNSLGARKERSWWVGGKGENFNVVWVDPLDHFSSLSEVESDLEGHVSLVILENRARKLGNSQKVVQGIVETNRCHKGECALVLFLTFVNNLDSPIGVDVRWVGRVVELIGTQAAEEQGAVDVRDVLEVDCRPCAARKSRCCNVVKHIVHRSRSKELVERARETNCSCGADRVNCSGQVRCGCILSTEDLGHIENSNAPVEVEHSNLLGWIRTDHNCRYLPAETQLLVDRGAQVREDDSDDCRGAELVAGSRLVELDGKGLALDLIPVEKTLETNEQLS